MFQWLQAPKIRLSEAQRTILEALQRGTHVAQHFQQRATVVLLAASGQKNKAIAQELAINRNTVKRWRQRWAKAAPVLAETEKTNRRGLRAAIEDALEDAPRSGCPRKITSTQFAEIIAMACETPLPHEGPRME